MRYCTKLYCLAFRPFVNKNNKRSVDMHIHCLKQGTESARVDYSLFMAKISKEI